MILGLFWTQIYFDTDVSLLSLVIVLGDLLFGRGKDWHSIWDIFCRYNWSDWIYVIYFILKSCIYIYNSICYFSLTITNSSIPAYMVFHWNKYVE